MNVKDDRMTVQKASKKIDIERSQKRGKFMGRKVQQDLVQRIRSIFQLLILKQFIEMYLSINIITLLVLLTRITLSYSNHYTMNMTCLSCPTQIGPGDCLSLNGGPFNDQPFTLSSSCADVLSYIQSQVGQPVTLPIIYTVTCGVVCMGCGISSSYTSPISNTTKMSSICANSQQGEATLNSLNIFYSDSQGNSGGTYDWCGRAGCSSSSNQALILGLVFGLVGSGLLLVLILYCCCRKRRPGSLSSKHHSLHTIEI